MCIPSQRRNHIVWQAQVELQGKLDQLDEEQMEAVLRKIILLGCSGTQGDVDGEINFTLEECGQRPPGWFSL